MSDDDIITFPLNLENMRAFMTVHTAVSRRCPFCGAKPGRGCTTLMGKKRKVFHSQRLKG